MDDPYSKVERVTYRKRETAKELLTVDDLIVYRTQDGGVILEAVRWDAKKAPIESFRFHLCSEDAGRLKLELRKQGA